MLPFIVSPSLEINNFFRTTQKGTPTSKGAFLITRRELKGGLWHRRQHIRSGHQITPGVFGNLPAAKMPVLEMTRIMPAIKFVFVSVT
jgi:hypothetical protein